MAPSRMANPSAVISGQLRKLPTTENLCSTFHATPVMPVSQ